MRRCLFAAIGGLAVGLAVCAGDGVSPRASGADYSVHRDAQSVTIAAALVAPELVKKIFPPEVNKHYVVVEVAVFPLAGQTVHIESFDFDLKFGPDEVSY